MKILLVGGQSALAQVLRPVLDSFAEVLTAGRSGCDVELDLTWSAERFELPAGLDAAINLAAHFGGPSFDEMLAAENVNVLGLLKLAHACTHAGVGQLVQVSSIFAGLDEDSPFYTSYALSKRHAEELAQHYCDNVALPLAVLRLGQLYGEGESYRRHQPFLYALLDRAQRNEEIVLYGRNDALRNFIHAADVAAVISRVVQQRIKGRYPCVSQSNVRFSGIAAAAVAAFGSTSAIRFDFSKSDIPDNSFAADESLYRCIGYFPQISLEQGLAREAIRRKALP
ncbi:MAG: NAD(P)-dependent oxidoreductase [Rhodoferax sp.]|nr:NAD(P)-dependent oxidoreductase [Rhodoferax sp.]